jgi:hypothetical protein
MNGHNIALDVNEVIAETLIEIANRSPRIPGYTQKILDFCALHLLPGTYHVFLEEIKRIADHPEKAMEKWTQPLCVKIVQASLIQVPVNGESRVFWEKLLKIEIYSSIAFKALALDNGGVLDYLPCWWEVNQSDLGYRQRDLEKKIFPDIVKAFEAEPHLMQHKGASWPRDLREEVNQLFERQRYEHPFRK